MLRSNTKSYEDSAFAGYAKKIANFKIHVRKNNTAADSGSEVNTVNN